MDDFKKKDFKRGIPPSSDIIYQGFVMVNRHSPLINVRKCVLRSTGITLLKYKTDEVVKEYDIMDILEVRPHKSNRRCIEIVRKGKMLATHTHVWETPTDSDRDRWVDSIRLALTVTSQKIPSSEAELTARIVAVANAAAAEAATNNSLACGPLSSQPAGTSLGTRDRSQSETIVTELRKGERSSVQQRSALAIKRKASSANSSEIMNEGPRETLTQSDESKTADDTKARTKAVTMGPSTATYYESHAGVIQVQPHHEVKLEAYENKPSSLRADAPLLSKSAQSVPLVPTDSSNPFYDVAIERTTLSPPPAGPTHRRNSLGHVPTAHPIKAQPSTRSHKAAAHNPLVFSDAALQAVPASPPTGCAPDDSTSPFGPWPLMLTTRSTAKEGFELSDDFGVVSSVVTLRGHAPPSEEHASLLTEQARKAATLKLEESARTLGANAILSLAYSISWHPPEVTVLAYGTACSVRIRVL